MASYNYTFNSGDVVTPARLNDARTVFDIVNADISATAAIAGTKVSPNFATQDVTTTSGKALVGRTTSTDTVNASNNTLTPAAQVVGTSGDGSSAGLYNYNTTGSIAPTLAFSKSNNATAGSHTAVASGDTLGTINFTGSNGTSFLPAAMIRAQTDAAVGASDMPGRLLFSTTADGSATPTERMRIDNAGNVGIANTSPGEKLDVTGNIKASGQMLAAAGTAAAPGVSFSADADTGIFRAAANELAIATNATEAVRVLSNGNVGIGVTNPANKLTVAGIVNTTGDFRVNGSQVVTDRVTGWGAPTGTLSRAALTLSAGASYNQADFNTVIQTLKALVTDLRTHGLIGS